MAAGRDWTEAELKASVESYLEMFRLHRSGLRLVKKRFYQDLANRFGRTAKSFEYRAQNISYVLAMQGRDWLPGLLPAKNVGTFVAAQIEKLLASVEGTSNPRTAAFETQVLAERKKRVLSRPLGTRHPQPATSLSTEYPRDAKVKAWVLNEAAGHCESCGTPAPFKCVHGGHYLEVHHVRRLTDGGSDTVSNAIAICPNCHRALHYSIDRQKRASRLYAKLARLIRE